MAKMMKINSTVDCWILHLIQKYENMIRYLKSNIWSHYKRVVFIFRNNCTTLFYVHVLSFSFVYPQRC